MDERRPGEGREQRFLHGSSHRSNFVSSLVFFLYVPIVIVHLCATQTAKLQLRSCRQATDERPASDIGDVGSSF